jgi:protein-S-isoprenylcysteine O-methyltransferase Ste14
MTYNIYTLITLAAWAVLFLYWFAKARGVKAPVYSQSNMQRRIYLFFLLLGFAFMYVPLFSYSELGYQLFGASKVSGIAGLLVCFWGIGFAIWARNTLGSNWSGNVTLKQEHELIQSGPYSIVRHPIYTGFFFAMLGAAITRGQVSGFVAVAIIFFNHLQKIGLEEKLMTGQFPDAYPSYTQKTRAYIPFLL